MTPRPARPDEAAAVSALALRSKAHWGYDDAFLEACRAELTWDEDRIEQDDVLVLEDDGVLLGFAARSGAPPEGVLDAVFVDPGRLGSGVGRLLVDAVVDRARATGFRRLTVEADPNAEGFYRALGAVLVGRTPSGSIPGRTLPLLRLDVDAERLRGPVRAGRRSPSVP